MKWEINLNTILIAILFILWWTDGCNNPVTNNSASKTIDSLQFANKELQSEIETVSLQRDSAISIMLKSLTNTNPVKKRHEKNRENISSTPADSLFNYIKSRSSSLLFE